MMMMKPTNPHFFKVILSDTLSQGKLVIPKTFVKRYGNYLSAKVFLKVPSGLKWRVELVKNGDGIHIGNGWQQFADYYSISHGSFLVFGFESSNTDCLNVMIFNKSASEIDYPLHEVQIPEKNLHEKAALQVDVNERDAFNEPSNRCHHPDRPAKRKYSLTNDAEPCPVKRAATSYKSKNPSFSITMSQTHVYGKCMLTVPVSFATQYFTERQGNVNLSSVVGKTWPVGYINFRATSGGKLTRIVRGWRNFVLDNHLAVGDVCVFELMNGNANDLKVSILRAGGNTENIPSTEIDYSFHEEQNPKENLLGKAALQIAENGRDVSDEPSNGCHPYRSAKRKSSLTDKAKPGPVKRATTSCKCKNQSFSITMRQTHVYEKCSLTVPISFATHYFTEQRGNINLSSVDGKTWSAGYVRSRGTGGCRLTRIIRGWRKFVLNNHLAVGDVCVFKLMNGNANDFKVSILKAGGNTENIPSTVNGCHPNRSAKRKHLLTDEANSGPVKRATTTYKLKNPFFSITMRQTHVNDNCKLTVPVSFATQYFTERQGNINLSSVYGKSWPAGYINFRATGGRKSTRIIRGWRKFVLDNHLAAGDVCVFKLINRSENELKVTIKRTRQNVKRMQSKSKTWNPSCKVILTRSHFQSRDLALPGRFMQICKNRGADKSMFVEKCKNRGPHEAKLQVGARAWPVRLLCYPWCGSFKLSLGFWGFLKDNDLQVGDACVFKFMDPKPFSLKVSIFRKH